MEIIYGKVDVKMKSLVKVSYYTYEDYNDDTCTIEVLKEKPSDINPNINFYAYGGKSYRITFIAETTISNLEKISDYFRKFIKLNILLTLRKYLFVENTPLSITCAKVFTEYFCQNNNILREDDEDE